MQANAIVVVASGAAVLLHGMKLIGGHASAGLMSETVTCSRPQGRLALDSPALLASGTWVVQLKARCAAGQDAVSSGGPLLAVLGFCILPLLWSVPEALITAELATAFPENSGYVAWVTAAFGPFWGFQVGHLVTSQDPPVLRQPFSQYFSRM